MNNKMVEFDERRKCLIEKMGPRSIAIIAAAPECLRNGDVHYSYRQYSDFYYLTGFPEPEAIMVLAPGRPQGEYILFCRPRDPLMEIWNGKRAGQAGALSEYGANEAYSIAEFTNKLPELLLGHERIGYCVGRQPELEQQIVNAISAIRSRVRFGVVGPNEFINLEQWLHRMRQIKSQSEIESMRKAAHISDLGHKAAMQACKPGMYEYQLEAELLYEFFRNGSRAPAYNAIVAGGENTCILHYIDNTAELKEGDLVLIDAGCEYQCYASDITRTFPVNGRFSPEQRAIYELVLAAQLAAIAYARPGITLDDIHATAVRVLTEGLIKLGFLHGKLDDLIQQKAYSTFYMHRTGHWLGLDTHDVGDYKMQGEWCKLEPGMVFTIEPGIYIASNTPNVDKKWWGIGVRIEDDVLVTPNGCEVLSAATPKTVAEIEAWVGKRRLKE